MKIGILDRNTFTDKELTEMIGNLVDAIQLMEHLYGDKASIVVGSMIRDWYSLHKIADARGLEHSRP